MKIIYAKHGEEIIVDDDDYVTLNSKRWHLDDSGYAVTSLYSRRDGKPFCTTISMHRLVNRTPKGLKTDHKNEIKLDNRKSNLRNATSSQNGWNRGRQANNTSGYKSVWLHKASMRFQTSVKVNGKRIHLGTFDTPEEAHAAYCKAAENLHGEFVNPGS